MCGIFGYFDRTGKALAPSALDAMDRALTHRGPDGHDRFDGPTFALGNTRLAVIDIQGGRQPFVSDDGQVVVVQNGEIFNHVELAAELAASGHPCRTRSDTEVLLRLYERDGIDFVHRLNGMFAIALYDAREQAMWLIRDRVGVKPLFIHDDGARLLFGSEIKALLRAGAPRVLNREALDLFLAYNYVPVPHTMFQGIRHLPPGHILRVDAAGARLSAWWELTATETVARSETAWATEFMDILDDAVRLRLRADVPFGAFLSGGVDSSSVTGLMARHLDRPVDTFCIGFDDPRYDEAPFAQAAADRFGTHHTMERVAANMLDLWPRVAYHLDQPHGDVSFLPTLRVSELARRHVTVVCTGDGGDELFAGYDKHREFFGRVGVEALSDAAFRRAYYENLLLFDDATRRALYPHDGDAYGVVAPLFERASHLDRVTQAMALDTLQLLPGNNLVKPDRMGMAVSLEARTPFLDYRMVELAFQMPGSLKLKDGETKYLYKKAVTPLIGEGLAYRQKQMFTVPVGDWFRGPLASFVRTTLTGPVATARGLFAPAVVRGLVEAHIACTANHTRELRALLAFELWARTFLDAPGEGPVAVPELGAFGAG